jgi:hypothetical protein
MTKQPDRISEDDVLRRLLKTPPKPHAPSKKRKPKAISSDSADDSRRASEEKQKPSS